MASMGESSCSITSTKKGLIRVMVFEGVLVEIWEHANVFVKTKGRHDIKKRDEKQASMLPEVPNVVRRISTGETAQFPDVSQPSLIPTAHSSRAGMD
ncbi:hypothetical protein HPP92_007710 [Vanilla planifolia]|uniref:Uncharacterized protein n=1 Tax=Vanilla planifolia TaxID=51239 RepID=A0A835RRX6_VANPL|nr:hypothetical protein HPP92_007710 [Vanilla planifolia]